MDTNRTHEAETLFGRDLTVTLIVGQEHRQETITVRKVALRHMGRYAAVIGNNEALEIAFYTGKPEEWAESLTEESVEAVIEAGRELSRKRYANFAKRATKFDGQLRQDVPALGQLADQARSAVLASRSGVASNT